MHRGVHGQNTEGLVVSDSKPLGITKRLHRGPRTDHTHLMGVPSVRRPHVIVGPIEVLVLEQQAVHITPLQMQFHRFTNGRQVLFVQHLVALDVHRPIGLR